MRYADKKKDPHADVMYDTYLHSFVGLNKEKSLLLQELRRRQRGVVSKTPG